MAIDDAPLEPPGGAAEDATRPARKRRVPPARLSPRRFRRLLIALAAAVAVVAVLHVAGGWYFSSELERRALSGAARRDTLTPRYAVEVIAVEGTAVTLASPGDSRLSREGVFGLRWEGGWGIAGRVLGHGPDGRVVRELRHHSGSLLRAGMRASLETRVYQGDPLAAHGIPFENVTYAGALGAYPAWFVPGPRSTWFVQVHGNGMTREDGLRVLPAIVDAGLPALLITYRNDPAAPEDPDGRLTYGKREWRDVEAAVQYALDHGAQSIVIQGVSMGGGIVTAFLLESPLAARVAGVILDAPMLDFERAVEHEASRERLPLLALPLPATLVDTAEWLAGLRFGVDWEYTHYLARAGELRARILLIHGAGDRTVPVSISRDLMRRRPDLVADYYEVPDVGHVESWNANPEEYTRRLVAFLRLIGAL